MIDDSTQYIARISHGKDSLKMLQVIKSRGLPLDRITTTDVWATDTISARLPPMEEFVARMDQRIWDMYHIEVEHLCAQNPDGTKKTYEQMFYHIPKRKNGGVLSGAILGFPDLWNKWCQAGLKRSANAPIARNYHRIPTQHAIQLVPKAQNIPLGDRSRDGPYQTEPLPGANISNPEQNPFLLSAELQRAKIEILWNTSESPPTSLLGSDNLTTGSVRRWWSSVLTRIYAASTANMPVCWGLHMKPPAGTVAGFAITREWINSDF